MTTLQVSVRKGNMDSQSVAWLRMLKNQTTPFADLWSQELAHRISGLAARETWNSISLPKQRWLQQL